MVRSFTRLRVTRDFAVTSTLALAISLAVGGTNVKAQAFLATPTVAAGSANITTGSNTTTITVSSPSTVINWTPNDNAINPNVSIAFQNSGTTATFTNNPTSVAATTGFAVLNNIMPADTTRPITLSGTIQSQYQTAQGALSTGGTVYFYNPGGILVGPTAVINVGNLGLSASPIAYNATTGAFGATGSVITDGTQTVGFGQANAGAAIQISNGAQINANSNDGSYVAIVAPTIIQSGTINVSGNAALVAADAATITFNPNGLYSITVDAGTSATSSPLFNSGTITGTATASAAIAHQIYLVTAPKNTLITMSISQGSNLGFDVAGAANVAGNSVILSAGYDIANGAFNIALAPKGASTGNIVVSNASFTSALSAAASGSTQVSAFGAGNSVNLASDVSLYGLSSATVSAASGSTLTAAGLVKLIAIDPSSFSPNGASITGGFASIQANGGTVNLNGATVNLFATAGGVSSNVAGVVGGNGTGGTAEVFASGGGHINVSGTVLIDASGFGGIGTVSGAGGGNGKGGTAGVFLLDDNNSITFSNPVQLNSNGYGGGGNCPTCTLESGTGTGGRVTAQITQAGSTAGVGSSLVFNGGATGTALTLNADGFGGSASNTDASTGTGGQANIFATNTSTISFNGAVTGSASGFGGTENGTNLSGGVGVGGIISAQVQQGGTINANGSFNLNAYGTGGAGDPDSIGTGSSGGVGKGGNAGIYSYGGNANFSGPVQLSAFASGGSSRAPVTTGNGGAATGGTVAINSAVSGTTAGIIAFHGTTDLSSSASGGAGYQGGVGTGGSISLSASAGSSATLDGALTATATGSGGPNTTTGIGGGNGKGGLVTVSSNGANASVTLKSNISLIAEGYGAVGMCATACAAEGGTGTGGSVGLSSSTGGALTALDSFGSNQFFVSASGFGASATHSNAGAGQGGSVSISDATGGALNLNSAFTATAQGNGGVESGTGFTGGNATGGNVNVNFQTGGTLSAGTAGASFTLIADAVGGSGATSVTAGTGISGGNATGGTASVFSGGGNGTFNGALTVTANAFGGAAATPGTTGKGGSGTGGFASVQAGSLTTSVAGTITLNSATAVKATGQGGSGYQGGLGTGGTAQILAFNGTVNGSNVALDSTGFGGAASASGLGGDGVGGNTYLQPRNNSFGASTISLASADLISNGQGGDGGASLSVATAGGAGGIGRSGSIYAAADSGDGHLTVTGAAEGSCRRVWRQGREWSQ